MDGRMYGGEGPKEIILGPEASEEPVDPLEAYRQDLLTAHTCAQRALDALYTPSGPKRSILYRMALGRAQSILIGLHKQELQRERQRNGNSE